MRRKKDEIKLEVDKDLLLALIKKVEDLEKAVTFQTAQNVLMRERDFSHPVNEDTIFLVGVIGSSRIPEKRLREFEGKLREIMLEYGISQVSASFLAKINN